MTNQRARWVLVSLLSLFLFLANACAGNQEWLEHMIAGEKALAAGNYAEAEKHYEAAADHAKKSGDLEKLPWTHLYLARAYEAQAKLDRAEIILNETIEIYEQLGFVEGKAEGLLTLSEFHLRNSQLAKAEVTANKALWTLEKVHGPNAFGIVHGLGTLARVHCARHNFDAAEEAYQRALRIAESVGEDFETARVLVTLAQFYRSQGRSEAAEEAEQRAKALSPNTPIDQIAPF